MLPSTVKMVIIQIELLFCDAVCGTDVHELPLDVFKSIYYGSLCMNVWIVFLRMCLSLILRINLFFYSLFYCTCKFIYFYKLLSFLYDIVKHLEKGVPYKFDHSLQAFLGPAWVLLPKDS